MRIGVTRAKALSIVVGVVRGGGDGSRDAARKKAALREKERTQSTQLLDDGTLDIALPARRKGVLPPHSKSHPGNTHVLPPTNRSCSTCSAPWARAHLAPYQPIILENRRTKNDGDKLRDCTWRIATFILAGHLCNVSGGELLEG